MSVPIEFDDPTNAQILCVSEDMVSGFQEYPFHAIAEASGVDVEIVMQRIRAMLEAGVIRRVRQTLLATKLAHGALCAWKIDASRLDSAFDFMFNKDPFSGHVVIRSTDQEITGHQYKLWTTLKVPQGESLEEHANVLKNLVGAEKFILMPAKGIFTLGVGHVRRKAMKPGDKSATRAVMQTTATVQLEPEEWDVLLALKEELTPEEITPNPWQDRAAKAGKSLQDFCQIAKSLDKKKVIGRFSTFLEHVKPSGKGKRVTRFNGLFHWKVPEGEQQRAGSEIGRHHILTHCYWREGGKDFGNVNVMGVVHGTDKNLILEHKAAIDEHLQSEGVELHYTNVFWGGRSEIKPSEISPEIHTQWHSKYSKQTIQI